MTTIYFMRHGETDWNHQERMQGQRDCPLNAKGRSQAAEAGKRLAGAGIHFDRVCSSPLSRARETARIVSGFSDDNLFTDPDILEMGFGPYEGVSFSELPPEMFQFFADPERFPAPEGMESVPHLKERTGRFLDRLRAADPGGTVLVVAHGVALRVLMGHLLAGRWDEGWKMPLENCCVYRVILENGVFSQPEKVVAETRNAKEKEKTVEENTEIILKSINALQNLRHQVIIAIDGRCGAGKTTLAAALERKTGFPVVHMDDFFLRPVQRTPERYATPGGNVDHERFWEEVLQPLRAGRPAFVRPYNCRTGEIQSPIPVPEAPVIIVEGSYSCHPALWDGYDLHIFLDVDPDTQMERIIARNGPEKAEEFRGRWIPLEELYFAATGIAKRCELYLK